MTVQQYLMAGSLTMGAVLFSFGLNAMFRPAAHLQNLGFPAHVTAPGDKLSLALMRIWGVRNIAIGSIVALTWWHGHAGLMAQVLGVAILLPVTDGFVSRGLIGGGEGQHWAVPPVMIAIIAGLVGTL